MEVRYLYVNEIVDTISKTHDFNTNELYAVNTSDILEGEFLNPKLLPINELKGQFKKTIKKDDILFSEIRPANKRFARVLFSDTSKYVVSTKLMVLRKFNDDVDLDYFYYWLTNSDTLSILQSRAENRIGSFPQITFELLSEYKVPVPEMSIQKKAAKILKNIDQKIRINNKIISELESTAKTLYDYWFLQFEFPNKEGRPYKLSGGKMVYNEELKREVPEGWKVEKLGNVCDLFLGGTPSRKNENFWNGNINWLNSGEVADFPIVKTEEKITDDGLINSATKLMKKGTVVISITGNIRTSILGIDSCANQSVVGIEENFKLKKEYLYPLLSMLINTYTNISTGNCQQHINKQTLEESYILIPESSILNSYYSKVFCDYEMIISKAIENQELASLRDFLLPMLMSGQVSFEEN